ncbi:MAG: alpha-glucan family phosphorylase [Nitrospirae bacterium]|nr:alpha-glucan family phosphorylase [Nitrospirota bacterium]
MSGRQAVADAPRIAYFSMEIALRDSIPTYAGGLGVLAGDTVRAAADLGLSMVAVTLLHREGYFFQTLDANGVQSEAPAGWNPADALEALPARATVPVEGRTVALRAWRLVVTGVTGRRVPVLFLDADLPDNAPWDRTLTHRLYGGDARYRICQEVVLGMGGVRMLRALGHADIARFHMNEGHAAFLTLELIAEHMAAQGRAKPEMADVRAARERCVFTTHTAVPAGHDRYPMDLVERVLGPRDEFGMPDVFCCEGELNLTYLALNLSRYVNGVAKKHGEIARHQFARYTIDSITNGVHVPTWVSPPFAALFDRHIAGWREDSFSLRYALGIPRGEVWDAHCQAKAALIDHVNRVTNAGFSTEALTLGFARRMTPYKRPDLLFWDLPRLAAIGRQAGGLQVAFAGKAHPGDGAGKELIRKVFGAANALKGDVRVVFLPNYDMALGGLLTAGVDVWLNTPQAPLEASGTSGMKAAVNGVPSLSVLDGWWIEGCIDGVTGWAIGANDRNHAMGEPPDHVADADQLYARLEHDIVPLFTNGRQRFTDVMRHAVALNGSFFNAQRMLQQYVLKAYF